MLRLVAGKVRLARCVACGTRTIRPGFILVDGDLLLGRLCFICLASGPQATARRMAAYASSLLEIAARLALLAENPSALPKLRSQASAPQWPAFAAQAKATAHGLPSFSATLRGSS